MKRMTLVATILLLAILLPACSAPIETVQKQAAEILRDASERLDPEATPASASIPRPPEQT